MTDTQSIIASESVSPGLTETTITRYGARHWAVYLNGQLLAVTVYKKGALAVQDAILSRSRSIKQAV